MMTDDGRRTTTFYYYYKKNIEVEETIYMMRYFILDYNFVLK
jgi:hypothetical protein